MFGRHAVLGADRALRMRRRPLAILIALVLAGGMAAAGVQGDHSSIRHVASSGDSSPGTVDPTGVGSVTAGEGGPSSTDGTGGASGADASTTAPSSTSVPSTGGGGSSVPPGAMPPGPTVPPVVPDERIKEFPLPGLQPFGLVAGPDGNVWFTDGAASQTKPGTADDIVGRITAKGDVRVFHTPNAGSGPGPIILGPDGALWFTEQRANAIGRITTAGQITEYPLPTPNANPAYLTVGPDGAIWFTEETAGMLGRITTAGVVDAVWIPDGPPPAPYYIASAYGDLWFTVGNGQIGRMTPDRQITRFAIADHPVDGITLATGPDGGVWYLTDWQSATSTVPIEYTRHRTIGRVRSDGTTTAVQLPDDGDCVADVMTAGADGNFWVTENVCNRVLRVTPEGQVTALAANRPLNIAPGPGSTVWFTAPDANAIGRIKLQ